MIKGIEVYRKLKLCKLSYRQNQKDPELIDS